MSCQKLFYSLVVIRLLVKNLAGIAECVRVYLLRNIITGKAVCVGFTKKTPPDIPLGDVIHVCILGIEETIEMKKCYPRRMISSTVEEAVNLGVSLIRAATLQEAEVKKDE